MIGGDSDIAASGGQGGKDGRASAATSDGGKSGSDSAAAARGISARSSLSASIQRNRIGSLGGSEEAAAGMNYLRTNNIPTSVFGGWEVPASDHRPFTARRDSKCVRILGDGLTMECGGQRIHSPHDPKWKEQDMRWNSHPVSSTSNFRHRMRPRVSPDLLHNQFRFLQ
jgi:hypothetical protein